MPASPQPRPKALAELEAHIARRPRVLLRMAEEHLAQLRRSREVLLGGGR